MSRLNLTLDPDTERRLRRYAREKGASVATSARSLLRDALNRIEEGDRRSKLAADYAAGRPDAELLLREMETTQYGYSEGEEEGV